MFITSEGINGNSNTIGAYNTFVQGKANGVAALKPMKDHFRAMAQPWTVDYIKPNTRTRPFDMGAGRPIYWTNGVKVADNYATCTTTAGTTTAWRPASGPSNEMGTNLTSSTLKVWTGSKRDGTYLTGYNMGNTNIVFGLPNVSGRELGADSAILSGGNKNVEAKSGVFNLYGMSPVLTVGKAPQPVSLAVAAGDSKVTLTWGDPSPADASIAKWQYRQKTTGAYGSWTDIAGGAATRRGRGRQPFQWHRLHLPGPRGGRGVQRGRVRRRGSGDARAAGAERHLDRHAHGGRE